MNRRLSELEKDALTQIDGLTTLRIEGAGSGTETPVPSVRLSQLQRDAFTLVDGQVAVRVTGTTNGGGGSCTLETDVGTTSFGWDNSGSTTRNFSVDNTGFQWDLALGDTRIIALCENMLVTPLPTTTSGAGTLEVDTITLDGTDIKSLTSVDTTTTNTIKLNYNTTIVMPNLTADHTFTVKLNLILKQEDEEDVVIPEFTRTLTYLQPSYQIILTEPTLNFSQNYISVGVSRIFSRGAPTSFVSTMIGTTNQTAGTTTLSSFTYNINTSLSDRTMTEVARFTNATDSSTTDITQTAVINPLFQFPIYLGSVATTTGLNTSIVNTFTQTGTFTSAPGSQNFSWPDGGVGNGVKVFGILKSFHDTEINFKANSSSVIGNLQTPFATILTGANTLERQQYSYYEAQDGQEGAVTLFVEFING